MGSVFGPIRFLLPVCRFCWLLCTFNIHLHMHIFRRIFLSNCWWQKSDIWTQASYRYTILWEAFLDPSDSYFLFADLVGFYTHWTYMHIFRHIFLSNYWWQTSDIWSQASYDAWNLHINMIWSNRSTDFKELSPCSVWYPLKRDSINMKFSIIGQ